MATRILNRNRTNVRIYADAAELALKAAQHVARLADQYVLGNGYFTVALSGGTTPKAMFTVLAEEPFYSTVPWSKIYFFWSDERCVPPDHPESNFRAAYELLLSKVPAPLENIFRFPAEDQDCERAARNYETALRHFFLTRSGSAYTGTAPLSSFPRFDLVLLGMGADGHTASLFPGTAALAIKDRIAVANYVEKLAAERMTLTTTTINNARNVTFLIAGEDKAATLSRVLEPGPRTEIYPSQLIRPGNGTLLWMVDEPAANKLVGY
jgi:6-phosphogluconolactonase